MTSAQEFYDCKLANKEQLAKYIEDTLGLPIKREALFDIQVKRCVSPTSSLRYPQSDAA